MKPMKGISKLLYLCAIASCTHLWAHADGPTLRRPVDPAPELEAAAEETSEPSPQVAATEATGNEGNGSTQVGSAEDLYNLNDSPSAVVVPSAPVQIEPIPPTDEAMSAPATPPDPITTLY